MDRKLEADVRLLSVATNSAQTALLPSNVDAYSLTSDEVNDIQSVLMDVNASILADQNDVVDDRKTDQSISIETDAYIEEWGSNALGSLDNDQQHQKLFPGVEYTQGTMKNRSGEPDSRFDVRSRGKINIDSAASQALHGFQGKQKGDGPSSSPGSSSSNLPLLAVAADGKIKLETLSWFGSIARRYGLEEEGSGGGAGRQARIHWTNSENEKCTNFQ